MTPFQIFACVVMLYGVVTGWMNGLLKEVCSTAGFLVGMYVAWYCYHDLGVDAMYALALCVLFPLGLGIVSSILSKGLNHLFVIGTLNRLLGAALGGAKFALLIYLLSEIIKKIEEWKNLLL